MGAKQRQWAGRAAEHPLTDREQDILDLLCKGQSNLEIAQAAGLTESTVKAHMSAIMARLEVSSRVKAVVRAYQLGLARP